jgi:hypothetical protein
MFNKYILIVLLWVINNRSKILNQTKYILDMKWITNVYIGLISGDPTYLIIFLELPCNATMYSQLGFIQLV